MQASQIPGILKKYDVDPTSEGCLVTNQKVVKTMTCFYCLSNLFTKEFVHKMCAKLRLWIEEFSAEGLSDSEAAQVYIHKKVNEICQKDKTITRNNVLMFRWAMQDIYKEGERVLSPEEIVAVTILLIDTDDFNDMGLDHDFFKEFINQPEEGEKHAIEYFENEVFTRL